MASIIHVMEKLWKKLYHVAAMAGRNPSPYQLTLEHHFLANLLDELRTEEQRTIETLRKNLRRTRPVIVSSDQLDDYVKRIEFANEILLNLEHLMAKTFEAYMTFINTSWNAREKIDTFEQQRLLSDKYDMSMSQWESLLSKIDRFNDIVKVYS